MHKRSKFNKGEKYEKNSINSGFNGFCNADTGG